MAWGASMTPYDSSGNEPKTLRYGAEAGAEPRILARRVTPSGKQVFNNSTK